MARWHLLWQSPEALSLQDNGIQGYEGLAVVTPPSLGSHGAERGYAVPTPQVSHNRCLAPSLLGGRVRSLVYQFSAYAVTLEGRFLHPASDPCQRESVLSFSCFHFNCLLDPERNSKEKGQENKRTADIREWWERAGQTTEVPGHRVEITLISELHWISEEFSN